MFSFMGVYVYAFATSAFAFVNLLRIGANTWLITFLITRIMRKEEVYTIT